MKIYTRRGDQGETSLLGNKSVSKSDTRIRAYGTIDELNAVLGIARTEQLSKACDKILSRLQNQLFDLGAELASPDPESAGTAILQAEDIAQQEAIIDELEKGLEPLTAFILPGGTKAAATVHLARCICRRAEREIVELAGDASVRQIVLEFVNRTSDLLFVLARTVNSEAGTVDVPWSKDR